MSYRSLAKLKPLRALIYQIRKIEIEREGKLSSIHFGLSQYGH